MSSDIRPALRNSGKNGSYKHCSNAVQLIRVDNENEKLELTNSNSLMRESTI